ncbi:hypothetical protein LCGC14_2194010, partial [marine sediment metagenome]
WNKLLGTKLDKDLAKELGCHYNTVYRRRSAVGIPAYMFRSWKPEWNKMLGHVPDRRIARISKISVTCVRYRRLLLKILPSSGARYNTPWNPDWDPLLGLSYDTHLAELLGVNPRTVMRRRKKLGVAGRHWRKFNPDHNYLLGTMSDHKLAQLMGVADECVGNRRRRLGIISWRTQRCTSTKQKSLA